MTEEQVFLAVLDLANAADRASYLDEACGGDVEFRRQVEALLAAHFKDGAFLDEPISKQRGAGHSTSLEESCQSERGERPENAVTNNKETDEDRDDLHFLQTSNRPDSLGRIGHYEVLEILGRGGFGIVFRAVDGLLERVVALKVLAPAIAATSPARKRFLREARSSAQVNHENVVHVYAVEEQPLPYLVMEFIPGETLQKRLDRTGPLEPREIVQLGRQIAEGLAAAHATGLIHRDIKPGNVLIEGERERVKITDFGLARAADDASLTQSGVLAGTPMYMAPEQAQGESLDHRADLFSLGSVLYVMATGRPPFRAATTYAVLKRVVEDDPRPIREVIPEMPQWLCDIIAKLQSKKPGDRFQSAREVADVLADCEAQLEANSQLLDFSRIPKMNRAGGTSSRWRWLAPAVVIVPLLGLTVSESTGVTRWLRYSIPAARSPKRAARERELPEGPKKEQPRTDFTNTLGMKFKLVPAGKFTMGSSQEEIARLVGMASGDEVLRGMIRSEGPAHEVEITQPFYMGTTEVTVGQFRKFVAANPAYSVGDERWNDPGFPQSDDFPVVWVSWQNAVDFCTWLSATERRKYRLPTEAEWEYSCRAGKTGARYCYGDVDIELEDFAWFDNHSGGGTRRVGEKKPNAYGLYDMHGNVFEFCQDWHGLNYYQNGAVKDPTGPEGTTRVTRGGGWNYPLLFCRSAFRSWAEPYDRRDCIGFRVLLVAPAGGVPTEVAK